MSQLVKEQHAVLQQIARLNAGDGGPRSL